MADINWRPISEVGEFADEHTAVDRKEFLLYISDKGMTAVTTGRVTKFTDGSIHYSANSFHGDWNITHFALINKPEV